jgi:mitochondrial import inner membrane translocase subunit TIM17
MGRHSNEREPCPWRLVDDLGGGYAFGMVLGGIWHAAGGFRNAPKGHRFAGLVSRVSSRTPLLAGGFAMWAMTYSAFECTFSASRGKEDMWNPVMSGACTGGLLAIRAGPRVAAQQFMMGGLILGAIEGVSVYVTRVLVPWYEETFLKAPGRVDLLEPPVDMLFKHRGKTIGRADSEAKGFDMSEYYNKQ